MKKLPCKAIGTRCSFVAKGKSGLEAKMNLYHHAGEAHRNIVQLLTTSQMRDIDRKMDRLLS